MPRLQLWNGGKKDANYRFIDNAIREWFNMSGAGVFVHLYVGTYGQGPDAPDLPANKIQDVLLMENRDRKYSDDIFELRGVYNISDVDFDMRQFGMFLSNDSLFVEFHLNEMIDRLGRKLISGDVLEFPHLRDDATLDGSIDEAPAINKLYVVEDVNRASDGYSATWFPHILRVKCSPLTNAQEYDDVLDGQVKDVFGYDTGTIRELMSTAGKIMDINEEVVAAAQESVGGRNFETRQYYMVAGKENPWIFAGDGVPPNGAELIGSGSSFPLDAGEGAYYLRTDMTPSTLYRHIGSRWAVQEQDYREGEWSAATRILKSFINNDEIARFDDNTAAPEKQSLYKAVKPKGDF